MPHRKTIQHIPIISPLRYKPVHERFEARIVPGFQQVEHLVHDDVFDALGWLPGQIRVEPDVFGDEVATSPPCFHPLHKEPLHLHPYERLPFGNQGRYGFFDLLSIPFIHDGSLFLLPSAGPNPKEHLAVLQFHAWRFVDLDWPEDVPPSPDVMAFQVQIFTRGFTLLSPKLFPLFFDPSEFRDREDANQVQTHPRWGGNPDSAGWRIDAEMDVFDVLQRHIHRDLAHFYLRDHQYSLCALMMRKMRSTSASFLPKSGSNSPLMMFSRVRMPRQPSGRTLFTVSSIFNANSSFWFRLW